MLQRANFLTFDAKFDAIGDYAIAGQSAGTEEDLRGGKTG
jgi:hypothetical protein